MRTETKKCPKCGENFECNKYTIIKCACRHVPLSDSVRQMIAEQYDDCLCLSCLREYAVKTD